MKSNSKNIGRAEMEVLHFVSDHAPVPVRDVAAHFANEKGWVRTTLLNIMERLREKGFLTRRKVNGVFHYEPKGPKQDLLRRLVRNFVDQTLGGSLSPFVAYLADEARLSPEELSELRKLLKTKKAKSD